jgi:hypothetical protein
LARSYQSIQFQIFNKKLNKRKFIRILTLPVCGSSWAIMRGPLECLLKADEISRSIEAFDVTVVSGPPSTVADGRETAELSALANKGVEDAADDDDADDEDIAMKLDPKLNGLDSFPEPGTEEGEMKPHARED